MEDEYENAQQAFLVGRYLKENGLTETLECFLRETPIKMVPKMQEDMQSLPQIISEFRHLLKDREELKDNRQRMQQYEEILNLLFEELRDVYNFQSPAASTSAFTSADNHSVTSTPPKLFNNSDMLSTTPERQFISSDFSGDDAQLIESFCLQNLNHHSAGSSGRIVPVILPKECNMISSEGLHGVVHKEPCSSNGVSRSPRSARAEDQPIHSRAQMLEHHYNRIREHRRINRRSKHRFLDKPISPISSFVAYSSLPLSSSGVYTSSCGHNSRQVMANTDTQKHSRSKKLVVSDGSWIAEPHEHCNTSGCADLQSASCKESSPFKISSKRHTTGSKCSLKCSSLDYIDNSGYGEDGLAYVCHSNQTPEAKLDQAGLQNEKDGSDADGNTTGSKTKRSSLMKFDQKLGKESNPSSHPHEIDWSVSTSLQHMSNYTTNRSSMRVCTVDSTAMITEDNQLIEKKCSDHHVPCGGGLHYKAFLREKFFSTRRRQHNTIHQQKLMIHHHAEQYYDSTASNTSLDHVNHDDTQNHSRSCSNNCTNRGEHVDAALLATETANLLERLLPLVADPDTMQSFISNLDTWSPRPSPRDHHRRNHWYMHDLCTDQEKAGSSRPQSIGEQTLIQHDSDKIDEISAEEANMNDDASVLAELEEAVGRTVDDILRRYILISPPPPLPPSSPLSVDPN